MTVRGADMQPLARTFVFVTVDTEVSMGGAWARADAEPLDVQTCIWCRRPDGGEHGIRAIMDVLEAHGLAGVFFVDAATHELADGSRFRDACQEIVGRGHDVQLHLHPAARAYARLRRGGSVAGRPAATADLLHAYDQQAQLALVREGCDILAGICGRRPVAFRAGNYAVSRASLAALGQAGMLLDFSYNLSCPPGQCRLAEAAVINAPRRFGAITEIPVTQLIGNRLPWRGYRPFEINALGGRELCWALGRIRAGRQRAASIVCHSFSMLKHRKNRWSQARPDLTVAGRFLRLAKFLSERRGEFKTATVTECIAIPGWLEWVAHGPEVWPRTMFTLLAGRYLGQASSYL